MVTCTLRASLNLWAYLHFQQNIETSQLFCRLHKIMVKSTLRLELLRFLGMKQQVVSTPSHGLDVSPSQGSPHASPTICQYPFTFLGGEKHLESWVFCPRTQHPLGLRPRSLYLESSKPHSRPLLGYTREYHNLQVSCTYDYNKVAGKSELNILLILFFNFVCLFFFLHKTNQEKPTITCIREAGWEF